METIIQGKKLHYEIQGQGDPLLLLHGNTASSRLFDTIVPQLKDQWTVITMDFLGNGQSERLETWPIDLWYNWATQANDLLNVLNFEKVNVIGTSGGALAALNLALSFPNHVKAVAADSFEGLCANPQTTEQIRMGRAYAKQSPQFCAMLEHMHGTDYLEVLDHDTEAVVSHAKTIGNFLHEPIGSLQCPLLLTGSAADEMFEPHHYEKLFAEIQSKTDKTQAHIFPSGNHPAMLTNWEEYKERIEGFFRKAE